MRALERNKQTIYFVNFTGKTKIYDSNGLYTGQSEIAYSEPKKAKVNISASRGEAYVELFGTDLNYTNTIVTDKDLGIDENSIIWIGISPSMAHNYKVVSVAKSLNFVAYAIRKVDVENPSESV